MGVIRMCLSAPKAPDPPPVAPPPTREQVAAEKAAETVRVTGESAKKVAGRQGVYKNIYTSRSGDSSYGSSTGGDVARFGSARAKFGSI